MEKQTKVEKRLNVRMSVKEYAVLRTLAARAGLTISKYIKRMVRSEAKRQGLSNDEY